MADLTIGVVATSRKPDERRQAIHPAHLGRIDADLRARMFFERGYGDALGSSDEEIAPLVGGLRSREELFAQCDVLLLPKPLAEDLETLRPGQVVWGWPHCVQDREMTQLAIDRRVTLIAWEAMNHWNDDGHFSPSTSSTRTTRWRATARSCTPSRCWDQRRLRPAAARRGDQLRRHRARRAAGRSRPSASARCRS